MENIDTIKDHLSEGFFVFGKISSLLIQQLSDANVPLFVKTMKRYNLCDAQVIEFESEKILQTINKYRNLINENCHIESLEKINESLIPSNISANELKGFEIWIANVSNAEFRGASHPYFMGLLFLNHNKLKQEHEFQLSIVHELGHQELFLLNLLDRLVTSSNHPRLIHSPYQDKIRPAIGRLHSAHALYRMIQYLDAKSDPLSLKYKSYLHDTIKTFENNELTKFGNFLLGIYGKVV